MALAVHSRPSNCQETASIPNKKAGSSKAARWPGASSIRKTVVILSDKKETSGRIQFKTYVMTDLQNSFETFEF